MIVKAGDKHPISFRANMDLTGATVRLIVRRDGGTSTDLPASVDQGTEGVVTHQLAGTLPVGSYDVEVEATIGGEVITFPNEGYASLVVLDDLD